MNTIPPHPEHEHYTPRIIRRESASGHVKTREVWTPDDEARRHHALMVRYLNQFSDSLPHATGSIPGKSIMDNVSPHIDNRSQFFYITDLEDAFPSVNHTALYDAIAEIIPEDEWQEVQEFLDTYGVIDGVSGLPLGLPTSPMLFNMYCHNMDEKLASSCEEDGIVYTRYLDDLTFSSRRPITKQTRRDLRDVIQHSPGMKVSHRKSKCLQLGPGPVAKGHGPVTITGVSIYHDGRVQPSPTLINEAHAAFDRLATKIEVGEALTLEEVGELHGWHSVTVSFGNGETPQKRKLDAKYRRVLGASSFRLTL